MDTAAVIFAAILLIVGLALIVFVRAGPAGGDPPAGGEYRALRQQELRAERRMQRRRWRVWHRVDELHAQFVERAAALEREVTLLPTAAPPRPGREEFVAPDIDAAYELFLRDDFLKAGAAPAARDGTRHA